NARLRGVPVSVTTGGAENRAMRPAGSATTAPSEHPVRADAGALDHPHLRLVEKLAGLEHAEAQDTVQATPGLARTLPWWLIAAVVVTVAAAVVVGQRVSSDQTSLSTGHFHPQVALVKAAPDAAYKPQMRHHVEVYKRP